MAPIPVTTSCYVVRLRELREQLALLQHQNRTGGLSEELEELLTHQIRTIYASLWAINAEMEEE